MKKMINSSTTPKGSTASFRSIALLLCSLMFAGCGDAFTPKPKIFDMTPLNQDGSTNDGKDYAMQPWACVHDNSTNLFWEVKKSEPGLQNASNTYSWYNPDQDANGGVAGTAKGGICAGSDCDTESYVKAINSRKLCGFSDWRLPSREEMSTLVDISVFYPGPTIPTAFFPEPIPPGKYWSSSTFRTRRAGAWAWRFDYGNDYLSEKSEALNVRVTRGVPKTVGEQQAASK
ncbi:MAG: DUF1566 domain-containing protein [Gallionella sp.]|nr:DUF1566 domain-containing protein [Gallionella sp.]